MNKPEQPDALRLADEYVGAAITAHATGGEFYYRKRDAKKAALEVELRRLHAENDRLRIIADTDKASADHWRAECEKLRQSVEPGTKLYASPPLQADASQDGCNNCRNPLFAGTKCKNCGKVFELAEQPKGGESVAWAERYAKVLLKLKDSLAERGGRPVTPEKAALWDEAWSVYESMLEWAHNSQQQAASPAAPEASTVVELMRGVYPYPAAPLQVDACKVPMEVVTFLRGAGTLDGVWFGNRHPTERGEFWWRKWLSASPAAPTQE